ncbi:hypothetical protein E1301_Tti000042 [Triplophysa tibetana]|uniref:Uncharacterized protein n=1 Tax=Triplophysa tibetana TaxID=1572043 RepID=A0A5A9N5V2_9TELE|nr:hypothetical protein E1301_Tti000042 [Triplophysa tibetana]
MVETLHTLSDLRRSKYGQPDPRHGLRLLWWFAREFVIIASNGLYALQDPASGCFGFRHFMNAERILPRNHYYKTGNLHQCDSLPHYVTGGYTGQLDDSNTDRLIVSLRSKWNGKFWFDKIYVTKHSDQVLFDQNHTYRISPDLIKNIRNLNRKEFLRLMKNDQNSQSVHIQIPQDSTIEHQRSRQSTRDDCDCRKCKIVMCVCASLLFILFLIVLLIVLVPALISKD